MCRKHWRMVPADLKIAVFDTYRAGQEIDKRPSVEYLQAARAAITAVFQLECAHSIATTRYDDQQRFIWQCSICKLIEFLEL